MKVRILISDKILEKPIKGLALYGYLTDKSIHECKLQQKVGDEWIDIDIVKESDITQPSKQR